jgi:hypothetical protein
MAATNSSFLHEEAQIARAPHWDVALDVGAAVTSGAYGDPGLAVHLPPRDSVFVVQGVGVLPRCRRRCAKICVDLLLGGQWLSARLSERSLRRDDGGRRRLDARRCDGVLIAGAGRRRLRRRSKSEGD